MIKKRFLKRILALLILLSTVVCLFGCFEPTTYEKDGVTYRKTDTGWCVTFVDDLNNDSSAKSIYVLEEIDGKNVVEVHGFSFLGIGGTRFTFSNTERIYFPWCIENSFPRHNLWYEEINSPKQLSYFISASTLAIIDTFDFGQKYVIPSILYADLSDKSTENVNLGESINSFLEDKFNLFLPANISYFFNYEDNPNEGYFFVDIIEETGKLTKPPYDPKLEGYTFDGWYSDKECTALWDFENDIVTIEFDENNERIYEEICLYAKWVENN